MGMLDTWAWQKCRCVPARSSAATVLGVQQGAGGQANGVPEEGALRLRLD